MPKDVHPQVQAVLDQMTALGVPKVQDLDTVQARALMEAMAVARREEYQPPAVREVFNTTTGPGYGHVPVRVYKTVKEKNAPVIVFFHGGGHVIGSLDSHDTAARYLALACDCTLVSVDYRMGPEHPFPAAVEDCFDATRWVSAQAETLGIDPAKVVVCGDSAGGNLAAVVSLMARDQGKLPIAAQVLIYPVIDYRGGTDSYARYGEGYGVLETKTVAWFRERYLPESQDFDDWRACPRNAASHEGLPATLVLTAECDVLRDEGVAYAAQLQSAGVHVDHIEYAGMVHGFFTFLGLVDDSNRAHQSVASFLKQVWRTKHR